VKHVGAGNRAERKTRYCSCHSRLCSCFALRTFSRLMEFAQRPDGMGGLRLDEMMRALYPLWKMLFPNYVTTTECVGRAMLSVTKPVFQNLSLRIATSTGCVDEFVRRLSLQFPLVGARELGAATDAIPLPQPKPRAMGERLIVSPIRSRDVASAQRSCVGHREVPLQPLDLGYGVFSVHVPLNIYH
jgi:hypothetical protein